ncbi:hypothetical protein I4U23_015008 [Adineta vaga]|nr:hypothetical protein I4U23_015008 [Adineta vaga]
MLAFVTRRIVYTLSSNTNNILLVCRPRAPITFVRPLSLTPISHSFPNMQQMMDELSKNPKAMTFLQAIKKDPKIMHVMQDLISTMTRKGYIDLKNPTKQPSLAMLTDSEIRTKLFELVQLLAAAGVFNTKAGSNPLDAFSNVMGLLMPSSSKDKKTDRLDAEKQSSSPKYDFTYDATAKQKKEQSDENSPQAWAEKFKKLFK